MAKHQPKENPPEFELDLSQDQIEPIILNRFYRNREYISVVVDYFDKRFFINKLVGDVLYFLVEYYKKFSKLPNLETFKMIVKKYCDKTGAKENSIINMIESSILSDTDVDEEFIKRQIIKFFQYQMMNYAVIDNLENIEKRKDASKCIDIFQKAMGITLTDGIGLDLFEQVDPYVERISKPEQKISFGYKELDAATGGGLPIDGRVLVIFMAQTNLGKSMFLSNVAINFLKQGKFVLLYTLEMAEDIYAKRICSAITDIKIEDLIYDKDKLKAKIFDFSKLYPEGKLLLKEFPPSSVNAHHLTIFTDKIIAKVGRKPDVIIIDYINLMTPCKASDQGGSYERVGDISKEVRTMSYKYFAPVLSCTQTNRGGYDNTDPGLQHVSDSSQVGFTSDFVGALWQGEGDMELGKINMTILKSRLGKVGKLLSYHVNYDTLKISEMVESEDGEVSTIKSELMKDIQNSGGGIADV